ncbi:amino acid adenylation domain-containing protein [Pseudoalteromonas piscicida]|uniref:non-ribosomal peptide synthetase n=1 Tax=Pseudoalteromonas piscicida TaxID=43662 RepID=UPI0030B71B8C
MSQVHNILEQLIARNIRLYVQDGKLKFNAPQGAFSSELKQIVSDNKPALIELLSEQAPSSIGTTANIDDWQPVSYEQKRMWFTERFQDNSGALHLPVALNWVGELDRSSLQDAFNTIINRHSALRTQYRQQSKECLQKVLPKIEFALDFADLSPLDAPAQELALAQQWPAYVRRSFDLDKGELLRAKLIQVAPDNHIIWLVSHHIAVDAIAIDVLFAELAQCIAQGEQALKPVALQYIDYAVWQNEAAQKDKMFELAKSYQDWLGNLPNLHNLTTDYPRPAMQSFNGAAVQSVLSQKLTTELRQVARDNEATLFSILQAAFAILLYRNGITDKVVFAYPAANRNSDQLRSVVGSFVNMVITQVEVNAAHTLRDVCSNAHEAGLQSLAYQSVPFDYMVDLCVKERSAAFHPLYQITIGLQPSPKSLCIGGDTIEQLPLPHDTCKHDFGLDLTETDDGLKARWEYNTDIFKQQRIEAFSEQFTAICEALVADPERLVSTLPTYDTASVVTDATKPTNGTKASPKLQLIPHYIQAEARKNPDSLAICLGDQVVTFLDLEEQANQMAAVMQEYGVGVGSYVGICVDTSIDTYITLLAVLKLGAAYVPLDLSFPSERLDSIMNEVPLVCVVGSSEHLDLLPVPVMPFFTMEDYTELRSQFSNETKQLAPELPDIPASELPAYVVFTSGSTGEPKGIVANHAGVVRMAAEGEFLALSNQDVWLQASSLTFDAATYEIWCSWMQGGAIAPICKEDLLSANKLRQVVVHQNVSGMFVTTALFNQLVLNHIDILQQLDYILFGGEEANFEIVKTALQQLPDSKIYNMYGPSENTTFTTFCALTLDELNLYGVVPLGRGMANDQLYVLDDNLQPVPVGSQGELVVSGYGLACEYLNNPKETASKFIPNPFSQQPGTYMYLTGDIVKRISEDNIQYVARKDEQVKVNGFRIEPGEIERALAKHNEVRDCTVMLREDEQGHKRICAYVICDRPDDADIKAIIRKEALAALPDYMRPHFIHYLSAFPLNHNGKIDKQQLPIVAVEHDEKAQKKTLTDNEQAVLRVWENIFGRTGLDPDADFFELGGDSLQVMVMCDLLKQELQVDVPMRAFFNEPTIAFIALLMEDETESSVSHDEAMVEVEL